MHTQRLLDRNGSDDTHGAVASISAPDRHPATVAQITLPDPIDVMGLPIRPLWTDQLVELLVARAKSGTRTCATYANAHTVNLAWSDASFRQVLRGMDILYADGMSVIWAGRLTGSELPERMTAADYSEWFASRCAEEDVPLYLLGGAIGVADDAAAALRGECPDLRIVGTQHGFFEDDQSEQIVESINASGAKVLLVGMSSPRQENWVAQHAAALDVPVIWCVGALFDYHAGREPRGPDWLCRNGGEWLYRLWAKPTDKWQRYLVGNPLFAWRALSWGWHHRQSGSNELDRKQGGSS